MKLHVIKKVLLILLVLFLTSCKEDDNENIDPIIFTNFSPTSGPKTTIVTIHGSGFGIGLNNDRVKVFFNEKQAQIQDINETTITCLVPPKAFTGKVKIIINGQELVGDTFTYIVTDVQVSTFAGSTAGLINGDLANAQFYFPTDIVLDAQGNFYITDANNTKIRKITPNNLVSTFAGSTSGFADGQSTIAKFYYPYSLTVDNQGNLYVTDIYNYKIRKITPNGTVSTFAGSTPGFANGQGTNAKFFYPTGIASDTLGNIYVADSGNNSIRKITPNGVVSTLAGNGNSGNSDGQGVNASFNFPEGIATDAQNNIYVADTGNNLIRKITPNGTVTTLAGSASGFADGQGANALFQEPHNLFVDDEFVIYVADAGNHKIRIITQE